MRWLDGSTDMNLSKFQETVEDRGAWSVQSMVPHRVETQPSD